MNLRFVLMLLSVAAIVVGLFVAGSYASGTSSTDQAAEETLLATVGQDDPVITVYKNPACSCCGKWVDHLTDAGFVVTVEEVDNTADVRQELGVPDKHASCHTGVIGDYIVEGHVPADVVKQMLGEEPSIAGIAVGGMPMGSPGMEGPFTESYDVMAFDEDGRSYVYASR